MIEVKKVGKDKFKMKQKIYKPELGQAIFGQPPQFYECPEYIEALLRGIESELDRIMCNNHQQEYISPFANTGQTFKNEVFEVKAYDWDDEANQPYNFKCGDVEISWYKYLGRGMSINRKVTEKEMIKLFDKCMASIRAMEKDI